MKKLSFLIMSMAVSAGMSVQAQTPRGVDVANLDTTASPRNDFYQYACGGWMKANPLTDEYSRYGTFDQLGELNRTQVRDLVMGLDASKAAAGSNAQKIADLYALGMDSVRRNAEGNKPIAADLKKINSFKRKDIAPALASMPGLGGFFGAGVGPDMLNSDINVMYWQQGGLGLGDRDYYLEDSEHTAAVREAYKKNLYELATLSGYNAKDAERLVKNVMDIETELAKVAMTREELRDPQASYNPMSVSELAVNYPGLDIKGFFSEWKLGDIDTLIVGQPKSYAKVAELLQDKDLQALRDYLAAHYIKAASGFLSDDYTAANFRLSQVMSGVQQDQPRWKRALSVPNSMLGEALGQLYVEKYFPQSSKDKMLELVGDLKVALGQHIDGLTWMSDETKKRAQEKLNAFTVKIGFPDTWRDYSALTIDPKLSYWENIQNAILFNQDYELADYGKPVDKSRWFMTPQTVNAYYNPGSNEICFPAGILQAPYFNPEADDAENYGAIGVVIGHEMTHGFDDQGRQFDKDGNFANWWTEADAEAFNKLADGLVAQFDAVVVDEETGTHANGRFTLGENIADQGGLRVAHTAYHNALKRKGQPEGEVKDGFTPDQRFYLAYANVWAGNIRPAEILSRTKSDPHSLGRWRVNASLRNLAPFFEAFEVTEGDAMYRPESERVVIW